MPQPQSKRAKLWQQRIDAFHSSNLSGAAFCREHDLSYQSFMAWKKKLGQSESSPLTVPFREIKFDGSMSSLDSIELVLGAITVRLPRGFDEADLRRVLSVVSSC